MTFSVFATVKSWYKYHSNHRKMNNGVLFAECKRYPSRRAAPRSQVINPTWTVNDSEDSDSLKNELALLWFFREPGRPNVRGQSGHGKIVFSLVVVLASLVVRFVRLRYDLGDLYSSSSSSASSSSLVCELVDFRAEPSANEPEHFSCRWGYRILTNFSYFETGRILLKFYCDGGLQLIVFGERISMKKAYLLYLDCCKSSRKCQRSDSFGVGFLFGLCEGLRRLPNRRWWWMVFLGKKTSFNFKEINWSLRLWYIDNIRFLIWPKIVKDKVRG